MLNVKGSKHVGLCAHVVVVRGGKGLDTYDQKLSKVSGMSVIKVRR